MSSKTNFILSDKELEFLFKSPDMKLKNTELVKDYYAEYDKTGISKTEWVKAHKVPRHQFFNAEYYMRQFLARHADEYKAFSGEVVVVTTPKTSKKTTAKKQPELVPLPVAEEPSNQYSKFFEEPSGVTANEEVNFGIVMPGVDITIKGKYTPFMAYCIDSVATAMRKYKTTG